jgi:hypothetical protein
MGEKMKNSTSKVVHRGVEYDVEDYLAVPKLSDFEKKIIAERRVGVPFSELDADKIRVAIDELIFRGAALVGCGMPSSELFAKAISEEMTHLLLDYGYGELTLGEIILAIRINIVGGAKYPSGMDVEPVFFTGNTMNVAYVAAVLSNYMKLRFCLDRKFQNHIDGY